MRVLVLSVAFPLPGQVMRFWTVDQARALQLRGLTVRNVNLLPWLPRWLSVWRGARAWARCPPRHDWDGVVVEYPRWLYYRSRLTRSIMFSRPRASCRLAWRSAAGGLRRAAAEFRPDVIYTLGLLPAGYAAWRLHRETGVPCVISCFDFHELEDAPAHAARRRLLDTIFADAAALVSASRRIERAAADLWPGLAAHTIHNGVGSPTPEQRQRPRPAGLADRTIVFSCGTMIRRKGMPLLVEAFGRIAARRPEAVLRIAGSGPERLRVEETVQRLGLGDRVQLLGRISHDQVWQEMVWSDIFALLSWDEPFATVFLEAAAAGVPIIYCDDGGIGDVVTDGEHGLSVAPRDVDAAANALDELLGDPEKRRRMGRACAALHADRLNWDAFGRHAEAVLRQAVEGRAGAAVAR